MSMMDDIEKLRHENEELRAAFKALETLLNTLGNFVGPTVARAQALHRMLVIKGVCTNEELDALEMQTMLEMSGQMKAAENPIIDPTLKNIVKAN